MRLLIPSAVLLLGVVGCTHQTPEIAPGMDFWDAEYQMKMHAAPPPEIHESRQEGNTTTVTYRQNFGETQKFTRIKARGGKVIAVDSWEQ